MVSPDELSFQGKYLITADLECITGTRIGGTDEGIEIGGLDNPVIKDPLTGHPYIPGSSLKGKMRSLMEWATDGKVKPAEGKGQGWSARPHGCGEADCPVCVLFGGGAAEPNKASGPTRLIVRDSFPTQETRERWEAVLGEGLYTELKSENYIDRITSQAVPRTMERVPAGSVFVCEFLIDILHSQEDRQLRQHLFNAMALLQDSALGGTGSRGSGRVRFRKIQVRWRPKGYYLTGEGEEERGGYQSVDEALKALNGKA